MHRTHLSGLQRPFRNHAFRRHWWAMSLARSLAAFVALSFLLVFLYEAQLPRDSLSRGLIGICTGVGLSVAGLRLVESSSNHAGWRRGSRSAPAPQRHSFPKVIAPPDTNLRSAGTADVPSSSFLYVAVKRAVDLALTVAVAAVALPVVPLIALAIKLDSSGPVFYSQHRVGQQGRVFRIHKFRSMVPDAEPHGAVWAREADPRLTRVGRPLRRSRVDELPQLWNVMR